MILNTADEDRSLFKTFSNTFPQGGWILNWEGENLKEQILIKNRILMIHIRE